MDIILYTGMLQTFFLRFFVGLAHEPQEQRV
jgi:hypothetical protein